MEAQNQNFLMQLLLKHMHDLMLLSNALVAKTHTQFIKSYSKLQMI